MHTIFRFSNIHIEVVTQHFLAQSLSVCVSDYSFAILSYYIVFCCGQRALCATTRCAFRVFYVKIAEQAFVRLPWHEHFSWIFFSRFLLLRFVREVLYEFFAFFFFRSWYDPFNFCYVTHALKIDFISNRFRISIRIFCTFCIIFWFFFHF